MPDPLRYHARALDLLGVAPAASDAAAAEITACEARCGRELPAAVREWFHRCGGADAVVADSNRVWPDLVTRADFLRAFARAAGRPTVYVQLDDEHRTGIEVVLDGSADPPVLDIGEVGERCPLGTFSEYVLDAAWRLSCQRWPTFLVGGRYLEGGTWVDVTARAGPPHLDFLAERFDEVARRHLARDYGEADGPAVEHCGRYAGPAGRVEVTSDAGDPAEGFHPAVWYGWAADEADLFALYAAVVPCHGQPVALFAPGGGPPGRMSARFREQFPGAVVRR